MTCQEYRDRVTVQLADGSEAPGEHGRSCAECARYAEQARAAWDAAGRLPEEAVPVRAREQLLRSRHRPLRGDPSLLRPVSVAAAAALVLGALMLFVPESAGPGAGPMMESDGMSVERYELPVGASPAAVAEELRRKVSPEAWAEGIGGVEVGEGFLRVRGPAELQRSVREFLRRGGK